MATIKESFALARYTRFLGFLIGIFGAMAILGVFFRIVDWGPYQYFMWIGFMGEASAFVIMGLLELVAAFTMKPEDVEGDTDQQNVQVLEARPRSEGAPAASFRDLVPEHMGEEMNAAMEALTGEVRNFGEEMHAMVQEMQETRTAMQQMRGEVTALAGGAWAAESKRLGQSLQKLAAEVEEAGAEMEESRAVVKSTREVLDKVASSNLARDAERFESGMKSLGEEVHEIGAEMGPARSAIKDMRTELEKVVSGDLAGDAERLGTGMRSLGDEMQSAGTTVERIRDDLDQMATRFRQFNHPMLGNGEQGSSKNRKAPTQDSISKNHRS